MRVFVAGIEGESGFGECNRSVHQQPLSLSLMCASTRPLLGISQLVSFNISLNLKLLNETSVQPVDASHPPLQKCAFLAFSAEPKPCCPKSSLSSSSPDAARSASHMGGVVTAGCRILRTSLTVPRDPQHHLPWSRHSTLPDFSHI